MRQDKPQTQNQKNNPDVCGHDQDQCKQFGGQTSQKEKDEDREEKEVWKDEGGSTVRDKNRPTNK